MSWFCQRDGRTSAVRRRSLDLPSPTICVGGMGDALAGGYWLEMDDMPMPESDKPPYRVPTMVEVSAIPWNGLTVASLFAGAGGSSTGYRMAGYRVAWASEFVPAAQDSYRANMRPGTVLDCRDVREVQPAEILAAAGLAKDELDMLDGSPPCQAFSTAGKRAKGWGQDKTYEHGAKQRNEDLFSEYVRILRGLMPRAFVAENVSGLVKGVAKGFFLEILADLKASGYQVEARLLDAQWLGVPQQRSRIIFIGVRDDLGLAPAFPSPLPHRYSVREACPGIRSYQESVGFNGHQMIGAQAIAAQTRAFYVDAETDISRYAIGDEADKLLPGEKSKRFFQLQRAALDAPCPAILASSGAFPSAAQVIHPTEKRKFTIAEVMALCSFPSDYVLTGSYAQKWARLGNSVPPLMMRAVAESLRDRVLLPARAAARTAVPAGRSPARSTSGISRKGVAPPPPATRRTGATRTRAPVPVRTRPAPRGPAAP